MTKVIILCAGRGSRLKPFTKEKPKCLLKFSDLTLLDYQIKVFSNLNLNDINIITGFKHKSFKNNNLKYFHNPDFENTNMVYSLFLNREIFQTNNDIIISYGDIIFEEKIIKNLLLSKEGINLIVDDNWKKLWKLRFKNPLDDAETLKYDENSFIQEIGKKTHNFSDIQGQYVGLIKIRGDKILKILDFYDKLKINKTYNKDINNMYMTSFLQLLINARWKVFGIKIKGGWIEFDSVNDLKLYNKLYQQNKLNNFIKL